MKLDFNFKKEYEEIINANQELADWFERNQKTMVFYSLTHKGCSTLIKNTNNPDITILAKIADAGLTALDEMINLPYVNIKIDNMGKKYIASMTAYAIGLEYEKQKKSLSYEAQTQYQLDLLKISNSIATRKR